jgi:hypothetical protein
VQIGTANFYDPTVSTRLIDQLPAAVAALACDNVSEVVGTLHCPPTRSPRTGSPTAKDAATS